MGPIQPSKSRLPSNQLIRRPELNQQPIIHKSHLIIAVHMPKPMHDSQDRAVLELGIDDVLDSGLSLVIQTVFHVSALIRLPAHDILTCS